MSKPVPTHGTFRIFARMPQASVQAAQEAGAGTCSFSHLSIASPAILMAFVSADHEDNAEMLFKRYFATVQGVEMIACSLIDKDQLMVFDWILFDAAVKNGIAAMIYTEGA